MSNTLAELAKQHVGSLALLARESGIPEPLLNDFAAGRVAPDEAHVRRIKQTLGVSELHSGVFSHRVDLPASLEVSEARVRAVRDEHLVRPHRVKKDDLIRLVAAGRQGERLVGWVKVKEDATWVNARLVTFPLKDGSVVECHPAQTVTVARKRGQESADEGGE